MRFDGFVRLCPSIALVLLTACTDRGGLEPFPEADLIVIGELKKVPTAGEIDDPATLTRARELANTLRAGTWSQADVVHSSCGTVLLTFYAKGKNVGYLGLDGERFFTNGPRGEHEQLAPSKVGTFLSLLPPWHQRSQCLA